MFNNNDANIKTNIVLPQVKISDLFIILYLHHCSQPSHYSPIIQCEKLKTYKTSLENDDKVTPQVVCFIFLEHF